MKTENKRFIGIIGGVAVLLLALVVAMQVTGEVKWSRSDFIVAGVMLIGTGLVCELVLRMVKGTAYRVAICAGVLLLLLAAWAELAVGIFGTPLAGS